MCRNRTGVPRRRLTSGLVPNKSGGIVGLLPRPAGFRSAFGRPQLRPLALPHVAFLALTRLTFLALTRLTFLALTRLGLATRQIRPQRRCEPLLVLFGAPMGHSAGSEGSGEAGQAQARRMAPFGGGWGGGSGIGTAGVPFRCPRPPLRPSPRGEFLLSERFLEEQPHASRNPGLEERFGVNSRSHRRLWTGNCRSISNGLRAWRCRGPLPDRGRGSSAGAACHASS